ncbi:MULTISPECIES: 4Fe-4S dicluster domain-containing protein [Solidesulfovibrio]|jgi:heterodisulfide reductase subunit C|uniref:4Fe-4S dicluster domain-containing protein n=1 Tax=Solidesulfovibrio TaxID=2910984 RepID=UPI0004980BEC|nr:MULTISPECIES: 4Fe-4S dicluster domain-containing protein [Solidesulfovibrio]MEA5087412.1 4Fe-4S dicluster domain-containing protein [Solidesulfovibrio sp.]HCR13283.1 4Fe-4S dicluster domain-containing protein [Desulfovibrio sp.]HML60974.1 4Fe-4S dicluster domain-containing protein [Solidesulfovibrio sp.]
MQTINLTRDYDGDFVHRVEEESGQNVSLCYQCGNCTAGCPYTFAYDIPVSQIMRLVQAGQKKTVLASKSIWLCATCESCTTRCPNNIDVACVMDVLRHMARREGLAAVPQVKTFWDSFLDSVKAHGRVFELGLTVNYVMRTGRFWTDLDLGPKIFPKGKLSMKPHEIAGKEHVARIFERFERESNS